MITAIVLLVFICFCVCWIGVICGSDKLRYMFCLIAGILISIIFVLLSFYVRNTPTAMDVYRGDTTLKYTVVDEHNVDSVVVFKNNKI